MDESTAGYYAPDPMPRWKRWLQQKFFPQRALEPAPEDGNPAWAPGECITNCTTKLSWSDRLRLLVSGQLSMQVRHRVDVPVGRMESRAMFNALPPKSLQ